MTRDEYRADAELRSTLAAHLPFVMPALEVIRAENEAQVLPLGLDGLDHARALAEQQTKARIILQLQEMATALPQEEAPASENFGTDYTVEQFDQL